MISLLLAALLGPTPSPNLIVNPDFNAGMAGFKSDYKKDDLWSTGNFAIDSDPKRRHSGAFSMPDHTDPHGLMLLANASEKTNQAVWEETVAVAPGQTYTFSLWGASWGMNPDGLQQDDSPARLEIIVNGVSLGHGQQLLPADAEWTKLTRTWASGKATKATIRIVDENTDAFGNDFAIDDLSFCRQ